METEGLAGVAPDSRLSGGYPAGVGRFGEGGEPGGEPGRSPDGCPPLGSLRGGAGGRPGGAAEDADSFVMLLWLRLIKPSSGVISVGSLPKFEEERGWKPGGKPGGSALRTLGCGSAPPSPL